MALLSAIAAASCGEPKQPAAAPKEQAAPAAAALPATPPQPGKPSELPDDRTPVSEAPFTQESAHGAANVLQTYYASIEAGEYDEAWRLREEGGASADRFKASFADYAEHHANVGAPSPIVEAAGSLYVEVPVQLYGRMKDGKPFSTAGTVTLRRSSGEPGATEAERRWRIYGRK